MMTSRKYSNNRMLIEPEQTGHVSFIVKSAEPHITVNLKKENCHGDQIGV